MTPRDWDTLNKQVEDYKEYEKDNTKPKMRFIDYITR